MSSQYADAKAGETPKEILVGDVRVAHQQRVAVQPAEQLAVEPTAAGSGESVELFEPPRRRRRSRRPRPEGGSWPRRGRPWPKAT